MQVWGIAKRNICDGSELLKRLNLLRGLFAIEILIGHVGNQAPQSILYPFAKFMIIAVGFFFFISGYGIESNFLRKDKYLQRFLLRKEKGLLGMTIEAFLFGFIVDIATKLALGYTASNLEGVLYNFFGETNWYLYELGAFYVIFYLIARFISKRSWRAYIWISIVLLVGILIFYLGVLPAWYRSIFCFPLGCIFADYENEVLSNLKKKVTIFLIIVVCIVGMSSLLFDQNHIIVGFLLRNLMCIGGIFLLCYVIQWWEWKSKLLYIISDASIYIYLFQFPFLNVAESLSVSIWIKLIFVFSATIIAALGTKWLKNKASKYFRQKNRINKLIMKRQ